MVEMMFCVAISVCKQASWREFQSVAIIDTDRAIWYHMKA